MQGRGPPPPCAPPTSTPRAKTRCPALDAGPSPRSPHSSKPLSCSGPLSLRERVRVRARPPSRPGTDSCSSAHAVRSDLIRGRAYPPLSCRRVPLTGRSQEGRADELFSKLKEKRAASKAAAEQRRAEEAERRAREERERQERRRRILAQREGILDILRNDHVPDVDWSHYPEFKIAKNERMLYVFPNVEYIEQRTKRETRGKSAGSSVRVAKGVSVPVGKSAGQVVETDVRTSRGGGTLGVSTKHVFFVWRRAFVPDQNGQDRLSSTSGLRRS